jgi:hypothetical protein
MQSVRKLFLASIAFAILSFPQQASALPVPTFLGWAEDQQLIYITGFNEGFVRFSLPKDHREPRIVLGHCISNVGIKVLLENFKKWLKTKNVVNDLPVQSYYFDFLIITCPEAKPF